MPCCNSVSGHPSNLFSNVWIFPLAVSSDSCNNNRAAGDNAMIIETSANKFYLVTETGCENLSHCWDGVAVKKLRGVWIGKKNAYKELIRKAGCRVVEE
jgi:hypothetical protein